MAGLSSLRRSGKTMLGGICALGLIGAAMPHASMAVGGDRPSGSCPAAPRPLPALGVAYAAQAALSDVRQDYGVLEARGAEVMAADRSAFAGVRGQQVSHQCGQRVAARTVVVQLFFNRLLPSASLSHGVVFVSRLSSGYRVWEVAH